MGKTLLTINQVRIILNGTGKNMSDKEIENLRNLLYSLANQVIENNLDHICKKH